MYEMILREMKTTINKLILINNFSFDFTLDLTVIKKTAGNF